MRKEKAVSLEKYLSSAVAKLASAVPKKHEGHPETYKNFLKKEIFAVQKQLEEHKLEAGGKK